MNKKVSIIVGLLGLYMVCQAVADVSATKLVQIGSIVLPGGTLIFAVTFTLRDMIHKRLGKEWARAAIITSGLLNVLMAGYLAFVAKLPAPVFYGSSEAWGNIFAIVPAITIGSITAEVVSELVDTEVYHFWWKRVPKAPQWSRVLVSNAVSLPLDSFIFAMMAFVVLPPIFGGQSIAIPAALALVGGQIVWKAAVTIVSMPGIYLVKEEPIVPNLAEAFAD